MGFSPFKKCTTNICVLEYGTVVDATHEYCFLWENIAMESFKRFVQAIWELFKPMYLKQPTHEYMEHQLQINAT
jgi:hypothetical protein